MLHLLKSAETYLICRVPTVSCGPSSTLGPALPWPRGRRQHLTDEPISTPEKAKLHPPVALGSHGVDDISFDGLVTDHSDILTGPVPLIGHGGSNLCGDNLGPGLTELL